MTTLKKGKGEYGKFCNRTDCQSPVEVHYYNRGTYQYYCKVCAKLLNRVNHDPTLCTYHPYEGFPYPPALETKEG